MSRKSRYTAIAVVAIILTSAAVKTYKINAPIADLHSWNQCSCAQVIRNFCEGGMKFFYPEWDLLKDNEPPPRYEAEEVPIYSFFVAILWKLFGQALWLARLSTVAGACVGMVFLFRLTRRLYGDKAALWALFFYAFAPLNLYFQRTIMTDAWGVAASIAAIDLFHLYFLKPKPSRWIFATLAATLAGMLKVYFLFIGLPILYLAYERYGSKFALRAELWLAALVIIVPNALWLWHASKIGTLGSVAQDGKFWQSQKLWGGTDLLFSFKFYKKIGERLLLYVGTGFFSIFVLYGLVKSHRSLGLPFWWLAGFAAYVLIIRSGNKVHNYYQLPYLAPASIVAGVGATALLDLLQSKLSTSKARIIIAALIAAFLFNSGWYAYNHARLDMSSIAAAELVEKYTDPDDFIIVVEPGKSKRNQVIFASHRKGWHFWTPTPERIEDQMKLGAKVVVLVLSDREVEKRRELMTWLHKNFELLEAQRNDWGEKPDVHTILLYDLTERKED